MFAMPVNSMCERYIGTQTLVLLDTNVWIDFAERKNESATNCQKLCQLGRQKNRFIFPLSLGTIIEVLTHPIKNKALLQARLMDELSSEICFQLPNTIEEKEIERIFFSFFLKRTPYTIVHKLTQVIGK